MKIKFENKHNNEYFMIFHDNYDKETHRSEIYIVDST